MRDDEIKINAKGLSNPGPKMMVESALAEDKRRWVRVIVSDMSVVDELNAYFKKMGASQIDVDRFGAEYHLVVDLGSRGD